MKDDVVGLFRNKMPPQDFDFLSLLHSPEAFELTTKAANDNVHAWVKSLPVEPQTDTGCSSTSSKSVLKKQASLTSNSTLEMVEEERKAKNKIASAKSRLKRKERMRETEEKFHELTLKCHRLEAENASLKAQLDCLRDLLLRK